MKVTISTLVKDRIFHVMCDDPNVTWNEFSVKVEYYFMKEYPDGVPFTFLNNRMVNGLSMVVIIDINNLSCGMQVEKEL